MLVTIREFCGRLLFSHEGAIFARSQLFVFHAVLSINTLTQFHLEWFLVLHLLMHDKLKESKYRDTERISKQESITYEKSHIYYCLLSLCSLDQMNCTLCWSCLRSFLCMVNSIFDLLLSIHLQPAEVNTSRSSAC